MDFLASSLIALIAILLLFFVNNYSTSFLIKVLFNGIVLFESISNILIFQNKIPWQISLIVSVVSLWYLLRIKEKTNKLELSYNEYNRYINLITFDGYLLRHSFFLGLIIGHKLSIFSYY